MDELVENSMRKSAKLTVNISRWNFITLQFEKRCTLLYNIIKCNCKCEILMHCIGIVRVIKNKLFTADLIESIYPLPTIS